MLRNRIDNEGNRKNNRENRNGMYQDQKGKQHCDYYVVMCFCGYRVTSTGVKRTKGYEIVELG